MQTIEDLAAGIIGSHCVHIAAYGVACRIHTGDDVELRVRGEQHHQQDQHRLGNNAAVVSPPHQHHEQKDDSAEQSHPMQADQRSPDNQTGGVHTLSAKKRRKLTEREGGKYSAKKYQGAQPDAERKVYQRVKEGSHGRRIKCYTGARPVSRSIRLAIGGWVEKRLARLAPLSRGATINRWAVEGEACKGKRRE
jgi:hypothetical protein